MSSTNPWRVLGIAKTDDTAAIRRAYADKLRAIDPDADVAGFAALRAARDYALRLAKLGQNASAVPSADRPETAITGAPAPDADADRGAIDGSDQLVAEPVTHDQVPTQEPFWPARRMDELLFPDGGQSNEGFSAEEFEEARQCLAAILEYILGGNVEQQHMGESWLADRLAHAWPRSAPLLADTEAALGWGEAKGQLGEHPAKAFLNERLTGMVFEESVQQADHHYHKAWIELSEPGRKGWFGRFRVSQAKVVGLLALIRERFPELEHRLDPLKVSTWEGGGVQARPWPIIFGVIISIQILSRLLNVGSGDADDAIRIQGGNTFVSASERAIVRDELQTSLPETIFGKPVEWSTIEAKAPTLASELTYTINFHLNAGTPEQTSDAAIRAARTWILAVGKDAEWAEVVQSKQLAYELASETRREFGATACTEFLKSLELPLALVPTTSIRDQEQALAYRLLQDDVADITGSSNSTRTAPIPASVVSAVLKELELSEAQWVRAVKMEGSDEENCAFRLSLMKHVLRRPGDASVDLLRIL